MSVIKFNRNFSTLFNWDTDSNPTTEQDYQSAVKNWTETEMNLVDTLLWQPETDYTEDNIVKTPSLPSHYVLKCTTGGTSGATEPSYENVQLNDSVTDGTVVWTVTKLTVASDIPDTEDNANIDASNIGVNAETDNSELWGEAIGGGAIASGDKRLVTGNTVYAVTNSMANSISANRTAINTNATAIATNTTNIATNTEAIAANATAIETNTEKIEENTTAIETNADNIETNTVHIENVSEAVATMGTRIDDNEALVEMESKRITNIEKLLQGNLYDYQTDTDSAYTKSVPAGAMPYAGLEKVGGKTLVWNQLASALDSTHWVNSSNDYATVSFADGVATIDVVSDPGVAYYRLRVSMKSAYVYNCIANHKYYYSFDVMPDAVVDFKTEAVEVSIHAVESANVWTHISAIESITSDTNRGFSIYPNAYISGLQYKVKNPMIFDLTLMFGAGNEPSTVEEFQQMFLPADYYAYNAGTLLSAGVTEVVSKDANNATLQTIPIPTAIRNLEGYGWSAGSVYNYIDFERKVFVKCVGKIVLDGTTSGRKAEGIYGNGTIYTNFITDMYNDVSGTKQYMVNVKADKLLGTSYINIVNVPYGIAQNTGIRLDLNLPNITTITDANTWLSNNNVTVYYELATPIETDISAYLTDDNLIEVEAGGTLTFPNQNGDDYQIHVPSEETYMIDLQEAINNG